MYVSTQCKWESVKNTRQHNTQDSQEVNPLPSGGYKAARNRQYSITKIITKKDPQKKHTFGTVSNKPQECLNMFEGRGDRGWLMHFFSSFGISR